MLLAALTVLALLPGVVSADEGPQEGPGAWSAAEPLPREHDWVQLTSGEWLQGEIVVLYRDSFEFESDKLDTLSLDFADVRELRSAQTVQVAFLDGEVATGKLLLIGDELRIFGEREQARERSQVLSITAGEPRERSFWSGRIGAGANLRRGNTEQAETNLQGSLRRRTVKNRVNLDYVANYNLTDDVTITDNQRAAAGWDRFVSDRFFLSPLQLEYFRDPFQNIAHRFTISAGAGFQLVDSSNVDWQASAGVGYQNSRFDHVPEGGAESASTPALKIATVYDHELTDAIELNVAYHFFLVDAESGRYTHHLLTRLDVDVTGSLELYVTFVWDRIQRPRPLGDGTLPKQDDFRLNLGLGFDL